MNIDKTKGHEIPIELDVDEALELISQLSKAIVHSRKFGSKSFSIPTIVEHPHVHQAWGKQTGAGVANFTIIENNPLA